MARKRFDKQSESFLVANFGFIWDCLKVVFKFPPDPDQSFFDFIMEKLGAMSVIILGVVVFIGILIGLINS